MCFHLLHRFLEKRYCWYKYENSESIIWLNLFIFYFKKFNFKKIRKRIGTISLLVLYLLRNETYTLIGFRLDNNKNVNTSIHLYLLLRIHFTNKKWNKLKSSRHVSQRNFKHENIWNGAGFIFICLVSDKAILSLSNRGIQCYLVLFVTMISTKAKTLFHKKK